MPIFETEKSGLTEFFEWDTLLGRREGRRKKYFRGIMEWVINWLSTKNQKKILFWICFIILSIAFITVWINILLTSKAFNTQMEEMVLGEDYYMEDIVITGKRAEDASADTISQNYFFYYNNGKVNDYHKRMQVPGFVYSEYNVGDSIAAYTTDHVSYSYYKYGILPDTEYTNNELMKVAGVLLGIGIFLLALFGVLSKKMNYKK